jgi:betaine-aldehyde dehydrogenase
VGTVPGTALKRQWSLVVDGELAQATGGAISSVVNPATEEVVAHVPKAGREDLEQSIAAARRAFDDGRWSRLAPADRAAALLRLADLLEARGEEVAALETAQTGKPVRFARGFDLALSVDHLRYFAGVARQLEGRAMAEYQPGWLSAIRREPLGVVGGIAPWNYPLNMAVWKAAPALAAGNTMVLKPASATPLTSLLLGELALEAGIPAGVLNVVCGPGAELGGVLTASRQVDMLSLTGDTSTGRTLMAQAAQTVKRMHLELGGKAPMLVFDDADAEAVVEGAVAGGLVNCGQDCTAVTRLLVQDALYDEVLDGVVRRFAQVRVGDPLADETDIGPLISAAHREKVAEIVAQAERDGATIACGGRIVEGPGFFFEPTIVADAGQRSRIVQEEIFGPVVVVQRFGSDNEGIALANDVDFALASSAWTNDMRRAMRATTEIQAGAVGINDHGYFCSEMPHGGFKQSGFGKDLSSYAFEEYTNVKHVTFETTGATRKDWYDLISHPVS